MVNIDCNGITVTQGDTLSVPVMPYVDETHTDVYSLAEGERFRFCVREVAGSEPIIEDFIDAQAEDGSFMLALTSEQTAQLRREAYVFDLALVNADGTEQETFYGGEEEKKMLKVV